MTLEEVNARIASKNPKYAFLVGDQASLVSSPQKTHGPEPCIYRGPDTGKRVGCGSCGGSVQLKILSCAVHGECTIGKKAAGIACCKGCPDRSVTPRTQSA